MVSTLKPNVLKPLSIFFALCPCRQASSRSAASSIPADRARARGRGCQID